MAMIPTWGIIAPIKYFIQHYFNALGRPNVPRWGGYDFISVVIVSPVVETFILSAIVMLVSKYITHRLWLSFVVAFICAGFHGIFSFFWFFGVIWGFYIMTYSFISYRSQSYWKAYSASCILHMLLNLPVFLIVVLLQNID
jgi:hypothetical protein